MDHRHRDPEPERRRGSSRPSSGTCVRSGRRRATRGSIRFVRPRPKVRRGVVDGIQGLFAEGGQEAFLPKNRCRPRTGSKVDHVDPTFVRRAEARTERPSRRAESQFGTTQQAGRVCRSGAGSNHVSHAAIAQRDCLDPGVGGSPAWGVARNVDRSTRNDGGGNDPRSVEGQRGWPVPRSRIVTVELAPPSLSRTDTTIPAVAARPISFAGSTRNWPLREPAIQRPPEPSANQPRSSSPDGSG